MATGLIDVIKRASMEAVANAQMCDLRYGEVTSINPLKVHVTNLFTLPASMLVVPEHLTDHTVSVSLNWTSGSAGGHSHGYSGATMAGGTDTHSHGYSGTTESVEGHSHGMTSSGDKTITIHNALKIGDKVALLRKQGGQSYFILDRI